MLEALFDYQALRYVLAVHEGPLVAMADGYARASGKVGFANVYMVPATANALSSIYTAYRDRSPLVVTSSQQSRRTVGRDAYGSTHDLAGAMREFTKWSWEVTEAGRLAEALHRAFKVAATPPQGPVFLALPSDVIAAEGDSSVNEPSRPSKVPLAGGLVPARVENIVELFARAERVLIICGQDVRLNGAVEAVEKLADKVGAAVVSEPWNGLVAFPKPHRLGFGEYNPDVLERIRPDLIVSLGARMFVEALGAPEPAFPTGTTLVALGQSSNDIGQQFAADVAAVCDVRVAVEQILDACHGSIEERARHQRLREIDTYQREIASDREQMLADQYARSPMAISRLAAELNTVVDADTVVVEQATTSGGMLRAMADQLHPYNWLGTGGSVQGWAM